MRSNSIRLAVMAMAAMTTAGVVQAGSTDVDFTRLGAKQQVHYVQMSARHQQAFGPEHNYDIKPAQLKKVSVGGKVDASRKFAQAVVSLVASDNLSGVQEVNVTLMSPSGQEVRATWTNSYPSKRADVEIGIDMDSVTDNGTWRIFSVFVRDANYFGTLYDEAALNAMGGRTTFVVSGARGEQEAPVAEAGGINLTPVVSKSTPPGGMLPGADARVAVQLKLRDLGTSGIQTAALYYCLNGVMWDGCFHVHGGITVRGKTDVMLTMGGNVGTWLASGTYLPTWLNIYDHAGNSAYYERSFGHDLDALLDQPAIVIGD